MSDALSRVLTRMANDYRSTVGFYGNIFARPGFSRTPRRLLSDTGFLESTDFTYLVPSPSHVETSQELRTVTKIVLHPYGLREDVQRLTSLRPEQRRVLSPQQMGQDRNGVVAFPYPGRPQQRPDYYVSADQESDTTSFNKTINLVRRITNAGQGPAYHFIVNRRGDIVVAAAIDDVVRVSPTGEETVIDVAVETSLAIFRSDWDSRNFESLREMPLTDLQLTTLAILCGKIFTAFPAIPHTFPDGVEYVWPTSEFPTTSPSSLLPTSEAEISQLGFDYSPTTTEAFFNRVVAQGSYDLAREVWRRPGVSPPPMATRAEARTAIAQGDTLGRQSVEMANYATAAAAERSNEMQTLDRPRVFVRRINGANADADHAAEGASHTAAASSLSHQPSSVQNYVQLAYDYTTGFWGDNQTY